MAAAYLMCMTVSGGVPLFTRKHGDLKALPFPLLASLNGVALFAHSNGVTLLSTITRECKLLWRDYHNSIRLIVAVPFDTISDVHLHRLLDNLFQAMVLLVGLDDLVAQRNIDRTKRDIRAAFPLIDRLLEISNHLPDNKSANTFGDLLGAVDCVVFPESNLIQNHLESYVESVDSTYGCVILQGKVVTATKNWWSLHPDEIVLLTNYMESDSVAMLKDTPIFLPVKSPTVPFRLVTCEMITGVTVCVLCGPAPSLVELMPILHKHWKSTYNLLSSLQSILPRAFPPIHIDNSIMGFLLVNLEKRRLLASLNPHAGSMSDLDSKQLSVTRKVDIMRTFVRLTVGPVFPEIFVPNPYATDQTTGENVSFRSPHVQLSQPVSETYVCSEYHKCFALQHMQFQLFAIFIAAVPNHSMRNIAHRALQQLLKDKTFHILTK